MDTIHGIDNHPGLKHNIEMLGDKLTQYASNQCDYMDVATCFEQTTEYIVNEFMKEFPECMGKDQMAQIDNLKQAGYLTDEQAGVLEDACQAGDVASGQKSYRELKDIYDRLCGFLPCFINWFFHPSTKELPQYTAGSEGKNRRARNRNRRGSSGSHRVSQRQVVYIVLIVALIVMWGSMIINSMQDRDSTQTASIWTDPQGSRQNTQHYEIGQAWMVEGEWEFVIDNVTAYAQTYEVSNPYSMFGGQSSEAEGQLLLISYHYTNLGYQSAGGGLTMSLGNAQIVDGNNYYGEQISSADSGLPEPVAVAVDETCAAQQVFMIYTDTQTATLTYTDPNTGETAIFDLTWEKPAQEA